jgi:hypothetical protein
MPNSLSNPNSLLFRLLPSPSSHHLRALFLRSKLSQPFKARLFAYLLSNKLTSGFMELFSPIHALVQYCASRLSASSEIFWRGGIRVRIINSVAS